MTNSTAIAPDSDAYYVKLFVDSPGWSSPAPNEDESARWSNISRFVQGIAAQSPDRSLRILEVGCGRGWLSNLLAEFGECEGVEPVAPVVEQARRLFPHLKFTAGTADTILDSPDFQPYDLVVTSEVIEHVPRDEQPAFAQKLARLLKPGGHVILSTPRGESLQEWTRAFGDPSQPVEDWLREPELRELFTHAQFAVAGHERVVFEMEARRFVLGEPTQSSNQLVAIYQVWAFQRAEPSSPIQTITPELVFAEFHRTCREAADRALSALPDHPALLTARATALFALGDAEAARQSLAWTVALHADHAPARALFAKVLQQLGHRAAAKIQQDRAVELGEASVASSSDQDFSFLQHLPEANLLEGAPTQLEVRHTTITNQAAQCIYLHPPAKLRFEVPNTGPGRFTCALAIQPEAWDQPTAGGCEFSLKIDGREAFRKVVNPRQFPAHRCWHEIEVEVPAVPGRIHEFIFRTQAVGSPPDFRWALWRDPVFHPHPAPAAKLL